MNKVDVIFMYPTPEFYKTLLTLKNLEEFTFKNTKNSYSVFIRHSAEYLSHNLTQSPHHSMHKSLAMLYRSGYEI